MAVLTGKDGSLKFGVAGAISRVRNWALQSSFDLLDTTNLGEAARTFTAGLRGATGTATIFYHDDNNTLSQVLNNCITNGTHKDALMELIYGNKAIKFNAYINNVNITCATGEVMSADISFTMNGDYSAINL